MDGAIAALLLLRNELLLFAGIGLLIGGLDDLSVDLLYGARRLWRATFIYSRMPRMTARDLPPPGSAGPFAIFVPAWREAEVIGAMLRACLEKWREEDAHFFVAVYPNDPPTIDVLNALAGEGHGARMTMVVNPREGPTTKADGLNQLWTAMRHREQAQDRAFLAVVLHDAEQVVSVVTPRMAQKTANVRFQRGSSGLP